MSQTVVGIFYTPAEAERAVSDLMNGGFPREKISLITPSSHVEHVKIEGSDTEHVEDLAIGAVSGGLLGGMLGALVGMIVVGFPGIGALLVAGPLAAAISGAGVTMAVGAGAGAVGGGILGALTWAGITGNEAHVYEEFIRQGRILVMVQASGAEREKAAEILHRDGAADAVDQADEWRHEGLI